VIRSSALLIAVALALLAAGVFASSLELVYVSIAVSILAAVLLSAGVILRRGEIFGTAPGTERPGAVTSRPTADVTAVPAMADGRNGAAARGDRKADDRTNGARQGTPAAADASPGVAPTVIGAASWPDRDAAARGRDRERAVSWDDRAPAAGRDRAPAGRDTDQGASRREREGAESRQDKDRAARQDRAAAAWDRGPAGQGKDQAAARGSREEASSGQGKDQAATGGSREEVGSGQGRDWAASWQDRPGAAARDRQEAAAERPVGFRVPPFGDRRVGKPGDIRPAGAGPSRDTPPQAPGSSAGDELWSRDSEELADSGRQDPARPAWPATAGPRAMGTGAAARYPLAETGDSEPSVSRGAGDLFTPHRARIQEGTREATGAGDTTSTGGGKARDTIGPPRAPDRVPVPGDAGDRSATDAAAEDRAAAENRSAAKDGGAQDTSAEDRNAEDHAAQGRGTEVTAAAEDMGAQESAAAEDKAAAEDGTAGDRGAEDGAAAKDGSPAEDGTARNRTAAEASATEDSATEDGGSAPGGVTEVAGESGDSDEAAGTGRAPDKDAQDVDLRDTGSAEEPDETKDSGKKGPGGQDRSPGTAGAMPELAPSSAGKQGKAGAEDNDSSGATPMDGEVTVVPGVSRYHRRGCILIRFLSDGDLEIMTRARAEAAGSVPCKACQPDKSVSD
jgi:hypothetical protein